MTEKGLTDEAKAATASSSSATRCTLNLRSAARPFLPTECHAATAVAAGQRAAVRSEVLRPSGLAAEAASCHFCTAALTRGRRRRVSRYYRHDPQ